MPPSITATYGELGMALKLSLVMSLKSLSFQAVLPVAASMPYKPSLAPTINLPVGLSLNQSMLLSKFAVHALGFAVSPAGEVSVASSPSATALPPASFLSADLVSALLSFLSKPLILPNCASAPNIRAHDKVSVSTNVFFMMCLLEYCKVPAYYAGGK